MRLRLLTFTNSRSELPEAFQMRATLNLMSPAERTQTISEIPARVMSAVFPDHGTGKFFGPLASDRSAVFWHGVFDGQHVKVIKVAEDNVNILIDDSITVPSLEDRPGGRRR